MASEASSDKFRTFYKDALKRMAAVAATVAPLMEAEEASLKALLRDLPAAAREDPSIKRVLFSMKDKARAVQKIVKAIGRKSDLGRAPWIAKNADVKLLMKMLKEQDNLLHQLGRNGIEVLEGKIAMMKYSKKHLGWRDPDGDIEALEQRLSKLRPRFNA
jgi:hypothetical protein